MIYKPKIKLIVKMKLIYLIQLNKMLKKKINTRKGKFSFIRKIS